MDEVYWGMAGRPLIFETPEELKQKVDEYFDSTDRPTLAGLALKLGFESRQTLYNYEERGGFLDIIKNARMRVEAIYEERLIYEQNQTGVIFSLKNMGWKDSKSLDHQSSDGSMSPPRTLAELYDEERNTESES